MITIETWNSFEQETREEICEIIGTSARNAKKQTEVTGPLKLILSSCELDSAKNLKVTTVITPKYE